MRRVIYLLLGGAVGALVLWLVTEPFAVFTAYRQNVSSTDPYLLLYGALIGLGIAGGLGVGEGVYSGSSALLARRGGQGLALGAVGGLMGIMVGQGVYGPWSGLNNSLPLVMAPLKFVSELLARSVGWAFIGLFIGVGQGLVEGSASRLRNGFWGGLIGGGLGGFLFELAAWTLRTDRLGRAIGFISLGGSLGLALGLAQELLKHAWVRVMVGRNEGRETILDKPVTVVGRDELADIGLFGDPGVGLQHAILRHSPAGYLVQNAGNSTGTLVNGRPVQQQALRDGDRIEIGSFVLEFHERVGRGPAPAPVDAPSAPMTPVPATAGICAYCGAPKDPVTGACACTPAAAPGFPSPVTTPATNTAYSPPLGSVYGPARRLVATGGPLSGRVFTVGGIAITVGREAGRDIVLDGDSSVSRRHATLTPEPGGVRVTDDGSANGTYVNGARVTVGLLRPGDELRVGATILRLES